MAFTLRDDKGVMKARFDDRAAMAIIQQGKGFGRDATYLKDGRKIIVQIFEIDEDSALQVNESLRLFLWKGDTLVPEY